jgi:RNA polymerase sigma-70 factor (ECF subfamily)
MKISPKVTLKYCSDEQLLAMVSARVAGWQSAFSELTGRHHAYLYQRCLQKLGQTADVEDVVQEVHFNVFRYAAGFRQDAAFKTWLTRIADNKCYMYLRRQETYYLAGHVSDLIALYESNTRSTCRDKDSFELKDYVSSLMAVLSPSQKEILSLRYWDGLSVQEISQMLGIGLSAAKMRIQRAVSQCSESYVISDLSAA